MFFTGRNRRVATPFYDNYDLTVEDEDLRYPGMSDIVNRDFRPADNGALTFDQVYDILEAAGAIIDDYSCKAHYLLYGYCGDELCGIYDTFIENEHKDMNPAIQHYEKPSDACYGATLAELHDAIASSASPSNVSILLNAFATLKLNNAYIRMFLTDTHRQIIVAACFNVVDRNYARQCGPYLGNNVRVVLCVGKSDASYMDYNDTPNKVINECMDDLIENYPSMTYLVDACVSGSSVPATLDLNGACLSID